MEAAGIEPASEASPRFNSARCRHSTLGYRRRTVREVIKKEPQTAVNVSFQGLIALLEDDYYVVTWSGFLAIDLTTWGWVMLIWGSLLMLAGFGLAAGRGWARWFAIVAVTLNVFAQLGFLGNSQYPLWALTALTLNMVVLYALTARWKESQDEISSVA